MQKDMKDILSFNDNILSITNSTYLEPFFSKKGEFLLREILLKDKDVNLTNNLLIITFYYKLIYLSNFIKTPETPENMSLEFNISLKNKEQYNEILLKFNGEEHFKISNGLTVAKTSDELFYTQIEEVSANSLQIYSKKNESNLDSLKRIYKGLIIKTQEKYVNNSKDIGTNLGAYKYAVKPIYNNFNQEIIEFHLFDGEKGIDLHTGE